MSFQHYGLLNLFMNFCFGIVAARYWHFLRFLWAPSSHLLGLMPWSLILFCEFWLLHLVLICASDWNPLGLSLWPWSCTLLIQISTPPSSPIIFLHPSMKPFYSHKHCSGSVVFLAELNYLISILQRGQLCQQQLRCSLMVTSQEMVKVRFKVNISVPRAYVITQ